MTTTMTRTAAIRQAKSEVVLIRTAPVAGGYAGARVNEYDHGYGAWVEGRPVDLAKARAIYKEAVVGKALALLGWEPWDVERVQRDSWKWQGQSVEQVIAELVESKA